MLECDKSRLQLSLVPEAHLLIRLGLHLQEGQHVLLSQWSWLGRCVVKCPKWAIWQLTEGAGKAQRKNCPTEPNRNGRHRSLGRKHMAVVSDNFTVG